MCKRIIFVEDSAHDDEDTKAEETAEDEFFGAWKLRGDEEWEGDAQHHDIRGDVEDGVCD